MRNFQQLATGVDVMPLLHAVQRQPDLWNQQKLRTTHKGSPHSQVDDIFLRFVDLAPYGNLESTGEYGEEALAKASIMDQHESIFYPAWFKLPDAGSIVFDLMRRVSGVRLGRVLITRLAPGKKIDVHIDSGEHAAYYDRYHCVLQNFPGSVFRAGDEAVAMKAGEVWWFDNSTMHEVVNNSVEDRLTMIIDIRTVR